MRWKEFIVRMEDERLLKRLFYDELQHDKRPQHKARKPYKDIKNIRKSLKIYILGREILTLRKAVYRKTFKALCAPIDHGCKQS